MTATEIEVLTVLAKKEAEIAAMPKPAAWQKWAVADYSEVTRYGPRYSPAEWFGGGRPLPDRHRVRFLRAVHALAERGLIATAGENRRLTHLKLTDAGRAALAEFAKGATDAETQTEN